MFYPHHLWRTCIYVELCDNQLQMRVTFSLLLEFRHKGEPGRTHQYCTIYAFPYKYFIFLKFKYSIFQGKLVTNSISSTKMVNYYIECNVQCNVIFKRKIYNTYMYPHSVASLLLFYILDLRTLCRQKLQYLVKNFQSYVLMEVQFLKDSCTEYNCG